MNILDSFWVSIFLCWIKCSILVCWVFASRKTNGGNCLCKCQPNFRCTPLGHWRAITFSLLSWRLADTVFVSRVMWEQSAKVPLVLSTWSCFNHYSGYISFDWGISSCPCCSVVNFPRFVLTPALWGCVNNSAGLLVRVLSNSLRGTDWSNPPLWRWGGHMKPKTKALLGSVSLRQLLLSFKPLQPVNQLSQLSMKTQCVLFLPVCIKDKGRAEGCASFWWG